MNIETRRLVITEFDMSMAKSVHLNSLDAANRRCLPDKALETVEAVAAFLARYHESAGLCEAL